MRSADEPQQLYTADAYFELVERGVLAPEDRVELLNGLVVSMSPQSPAHATTICLLQDVLVHRLLAGMHVRVQMDLVLNDSYVPEPDIAVVAGEPGDYALSHPTAALLIVEVADSSLAQDRITKTALYAAAGIPEYWVVNLRTRQVDVRRDPTSAGYRAMSTLGVSETITSPLLDAPIAIAEIVPATA
jgi:Uma2 family endonuclease